MINKFIEDNHAKLDESATHHVGLWLNKIDNVLDIDVSKNIQDRAEAFAFGRTHNQLALYNVNTKEVHPIMKDGKRPEDPAGTGEFNESEQPQRDGTQFYVSSSADVAAVAKAIAAQMEINDKAIKGKL